MTDFDKKWKIYTDSLPKGEKATPEGFGRMWGESRFSITEKEATRMANDALKTMFLDPTTPEGQAKFNELKRYYLQQGSASGATSLSPQDQQALNWANANPNDPRAKQIKEHLGVK
jgi:hypothetical protein